MNVCATLGSSMMRRSRGVGRSTKNAAFSSVAETKLSTQGKGGGGSDKGLNIPAPPNLGPVQTHEVAVEDLPEVISQMSANSDFAFSEEYECLETGQ